MLFPPTSIAGVEHLSSSVIVIMESKRIDSKDTIESSTREVVESKKFYFPIYSDTQLFVEKESDLTW